MVVNEVDWNDIPGYKLILDCFIKEMEIRNINNLPDSLRQASVSFISNARLLNQFVKIIFNKTPVYDAQAVNSTLDLVVMLITKIHRNKALIPPDFDFGFYFKAIRMLLRLDHGTSTAKCVWVLY